MNPATTGSRHGMKPLNRRTRTGRSLRGPGAPHPGASPPPGTARPPGPVVRLGHAIGHGPDASDGTVTTGRLPLADDPGRARARWLPAQAGSA
ncbi:hypothetical protein ADZ36_06990 [Streptomyces fradiae]|uniref:Uncharacterized protein n=2 Tax=Streptomyces TaxID=1883 RepID=A0A420V460_9ACTN|nr:hypothetical protein ADZ36_06990 [Streptomyces fradiae]OFA48481.1 hypothetical protein BEN35_18845 [Streptomyces fradiae]PQM20073.1 hypothetical protein Sfr7A_28290 [Streptomyces xinghaiensis]RKM95997.1 hypothetical protein SFRA_013465 [Streptomyces xinghaiensis]RNC69954.1 hypothetical protein DC095_027350 [Streptomyces xinghaiensis]